MLVCSTRPVPRLTDLRADELTEIMHAVQRVGCVIERAYKADGLTIACQVNNNNNNNTHHTPTHPIPSHFFSTHH